MLLNLKRVFMAHKKLSKRLKEAPYIFKRLYYSSMMKS